MLTLYYYAIIPRNIYIYIYIYIYYDRARQRAKYTVTSGQSDPDRWTGTYFLSTPKTSHV